MIPCIDLRAQYISRRTEVDAAIKDVLDGGKYIHGNNVVRFEQDFSKIGRAHV